MIIGAGLTAAYRRMVSFARRPTVKAVVTLAELVGGFAVAGISIAQGAISIIGMPWIAVGNMLTTVSTVAFIQWSHRD